MKTNRLFCLIELAAVAALYFFENNSGTRAALAVSALVPTRPEIGRAHV